MITLQPITETNFLTAAALSVSPDQGRYVAPAPIILALAYAYRRHRASAWGVYDGCRMVGLALMEDLDEEPACYHLSELLIDEKEQGKGYGKAAFAAVLDYIRTKPFGKSGRILLTCNRENPAALGLYQSFDFCPTGNGDEDEIELGYTFKAK